MKILFLTHLKDDAQAKNDIINDSTLHGLREIYGENVVDYPGAWYMYKDEIARKSFDISKLWGSGFTYYDNLDNYNSIDRTDIKKKSRIIFLITLYMDRIHVRIYFLKNLYTQKVK